MKKEYLVPEMEVVELENIDIITTSTGFDEGEDNLDNQSLD